MNATYPRVLFVSVLPLLLAVTFLKEAGAQTVTSLDSDLFAPADSTACRARIPRDVGPVFHGKPGHRSIASRAG